MSTIPNHPKCTSIYPPINMSTHPKPPKIYPQPPPPTHKKCPPKKQTSTHHQSPSPTHKNFSLTSYLTPPISHSHIKNEKMFTQTPATQNLPFHSTPLTPLTNKKLTLTSTKIYYPTKIHLHQIPTDT